MSRKSIVLLLPLFAACVWEPNHQETHDRNVPIDVMGFAQNPGATIQIKAFNFNTNSYQTVATTTASTTGWFSGPSIYPYSYDNLLLPQNFWVPPGGGCADSGMASLRLYEDGVLLYTFDEAQQDCVLDEVSAGAHPFNAGNTCGTAGQLVLFSPPTC